MSKKLNTKALKGFTIIEVMIVLAIAGLIMVVVLIAVPQLQRSQRDNARQAVLNRVNSELNNYAGNNDGTYPFENDADLADFVTRYLPTAQVDRRNPSTGNPYNLVLNANGAPVNPGAGDIRIYPGARCAGEVVTANSTRGANVRRYAMVVQLERGSVFYCVDNNQ